MERVDFPNKGVVRVGEETCIVKNSLPGQKIKLIVNKVRKGKAEARLLEVLEPSPMETGHPCSHFGVCGGCAYLSLLYEDQLAIKESQVKKLLDKALEGQEEPWTWEGIRPSPREYEYRNKMEFTFGDEVKDGPLALGMHRRGSFYDVVTVEDCRIVDGDYRLILKTALDYFAERKVPYYHRLRHEGYLRHLLVRKASGTGEILAALVTSSQFPGGEEVLSDTGGQASMEGGEQLSVGARVSMEGGEQLPVGARASMEGGDLLPAGARASAEEEALLEGFRDALLSLEREGKLSGRFAGILHILNDSAADAIKSDRTDVLYGRDYFYEELLGLKFRISVFSFFQTNSYGAKVLYETVREYVKSKDAEGVVFDLYSGTGTIAQLVAPVARQVIGVEIVEEAVEAARRNAGENGLANCKFLAGDVLKVLDEIEEKPDLIILDPPRDGVHPKALPKILAYGVRRIIYISCKPTSLARDLEAFRENGYQVERAVAVDQFPWTANVETVCLLSNRKSDTKVRTDVDLKDYYRIKDSEKKGSSLRL